MPSDTIEERGQELAEEFAFLPDWTGRYEYVIGMGKKMPKIPEEEKSEETYVQGCQSDVWIQALYEEAGGVVRFRGDSNADITKGLTALLIRLLDEQTPSAIAAADLNVLEEIGLREHLSAQRQNGLDAMIEQMKARAGRYLEAEAG